ncbi:MAG: metalloregulator ArsR/SmtB family transcription factor [Trueperaceae bacterium]|nr:metalloregulator ArsR/SmtB family transcription factor [Trueperaceae bacterium]
MRAQRFKALGDPTRLRILSSLQDCEHCACELQVAVDVPGNLLSHHLKVLREAGLVTATRRGRWVDYRIERGVLAGLAADLAEVADGPASCRMDDTREGACGG